MVVATCPPYLGRLSKKEDLRVTTGQQRLPSKVLSQKQTNKRENTNQTK